MKSFTTSGAISELEKRVIALEQENKDLRKTLTETVKLTNHHYEMIEGILDILRELAK